MNSLKEITILSLKMSKRPNKSLKKLNPSLPLIMFKLLLIGWLSQKDSSSKENKRLISLRLFLLTKKDQTHISCLINNLIVLRSDHLYKLVNNLSIGKRKKR
jgi:hypothetical protein